MMGWKPRSDRADSELSVIDLCPTVPMQTSVPLVLVFWRLPSIVVMSYRTRM
jgi:hypothetical protein